MKRHELRVDSHATKNPWYLDTAGRKWIVLGESKKGKRMIYHLASPVGKQKDIQVGEDLMGQMNPLANCCREHDGERYVDPWSGKWHTKECIVDEVDFLGTWPGFRQPKFKHPSGLSLKERKKQLLDAVKG